MSTASNAVEQYLIEVHHKKHERTLSLRADMVGVLESPGFMSMVISYHMGVLRKHLEFGGTYYVVLEKRQPVISVQTASNEAGASCSYLLGIKRMPTAKIELLVNVRYHVEGFVGDLRYGLDGVSVYGEALIDRDVFKCDGAEYERDPTRFFEVINSLISLKRL